MKKIKETLIHWLGGLVVEDTQSFFNEGYKCGKCIVMKNIKAYADSLYGLSADEWCKKMYEFIEEVYDVHEDCKIDV